MVQLQGHATHYEILGISRSASRDEIDRACVALWYRHQSMRTTPLWKDLNRHIEDIRNTLLDPKARAAYDRRLRSEHDGHDELAARAGDADDSVSASQPAGQPALPPEGATVAPQAEHRAGRASKTSFRLSPYPAIMAPAMLFNQMVDWVHPESWQDMQNIALLALVLSVAMTGLMWSASRLLQMHTMKVAEGETQ